MDLGLKGKTVLITGASRNMGRLAALAFAKEGANLAICTSAKMQELGEVAAEVRALGVKVVAERCDVADSASVADFVAKTCSELGSVHVVLNNAVYRGGEGAFLDDTDAVGAQFRGQPRRAAQHLPRGDPVDGETALGPHHQFFRHFAFCRQQHRQRHGEAGHCGIHPRARP